MNVVPLLLERMRAALDAHDLDAFVDFFHEDYVGERPRHPDAAPSTREDVRANWAEVIRDVPDLRVEIPAATLAGDTIWSEWRAYGTARSGAPLELRGAIIFGVRDGCVAWSRMYFDPVEQAGKPLPAFVAPALAHVLDLDDREGSGAEKGSGAKNGPVRLRPMGSDP